MKIRILMFFVFQVVAWSLYFNWDTAKSINFSSSQASKTLQVVEMGSIQEASTLSDNDLLYQLVLRTDGIFTKFNDDQSVENGVWRINYDIPSIILKSPQVDYKYRILQASDDQLQLELINYHEILEAKKPKDESRTLFSTFK